MYYLNVAAPYDRIVPGAKADVVVRDTRIHIGVYCVRPWVFPRALNQMGNSGECCERVYRVIRRDLKGGQPTSRCACLPHWDNPLEDQEESEGEGS